MILTLLLVIACDKNKKITVTSIHDSIIYGKTTRDDLINIFGKPNKIEKNQKKVINQYHEDNDNEGGISDLLESNTDYYQTLNFTKDKHNGNYSEYYEYNSKESGLKYIRFYFIEDKVRFFMLGDISDKQIAKKDKYLNKIIDK